MFPCLYEGNVPVTFGGRIIFVIKCSQLNLVISFKYKFSSENYFLLFSELFIFSPENYFSQKHSKWPSLGVMEDLEQEEFHSHSSGCQPCQMFLLTAVYYKKKEQRGAILGPILILFLFNLGTIFSHDIVLGIAYYC